MCLVEFDESVGECTQMEEGKWSQTANQIQECQHRNHLTGVFYNAESGPRVERSVILGNVSELWLSVKFEKSAIS